MMVRPFIWAALTAGVLMVVYNHDDGAANGHGGDEFVWRGEVPEGNWINIRNTNGPVRIDSTAGSMVEVKAKKHWRRGRPKDVRFKVSQEGHDVYVCALWGTRGRCGEDRYSASTPWWRRVINKGSDVRVDFTVRVPRGVKVNASTVNGAIEVDGAGAEVDVETVNGRIEAATSGPVRAETVNGSIVARMDSLPGDRGGDIQLETVNGSITAYVPAGFDAVFEAETVHGRITTDFPITTTGTLSPKHLRGTIGRGGRSVSLETVNGSVQLLKSGG